MLSRCVRFFQKSIDGSPIDDRPFIALKSQAAQLSLNHQTVFTRCHHQQPLTLLAHRQRDQDRIGQGMNGSQCTLWQCSRQVFEKHACAPLIKPQFHSPVGPHLLIGHVQFLFLTCVFLPLLNKAIGTLFVPLQIALCIIKCGVPHGRMLHAGRHPNLSLKIVDACLQPVTPVHLQCSIRRSPRRNILVHSSTA